MWRTPALYISSYRCSTAPPGWPNLTSTPSARKHSTKAWAARMRTGAVFRLFQDSLADHSTADIISPRPSPSDELSLQNKIPPAPTRWSRQGREDRSPSRYHPDSPRSCDLDLLGFPGKPSPP